MPVIGQGTFGSYVQIDPVRLAKLLNSSEGPVARMLLEDGEAVKVEAQRRVGVWKPAPGDTYSASHRTRRPGTLRDSIVKRLAESSGGVECLVGSNDPIALLHHEGTQPHHISARNAPMLVFFSARAGKVVRARTVNHPGTKPRRYLTDALQVLVARHHG